MTNLVTPVAVVVKVELSFRLNEDVEPVRAIEKAYGFEADNMLSYGPSSDCWQVANQLQWHGHFLLPIY